MTAAMATTSMNEPMAYMSLSLPPVGLNTCAAWGAGLGGAGERRLWRAEMGAWAAVMNQAHRADTHTDCLRRGGGQQAQQAPITHLGFLPSWPTLFHITIGKKTDRGKKHTLPTRPTTAVNEGCKTRRSQGGGEGEGGMLVQPAQLCTAAATIPAVAPHTTACRAASAPWQAPTHHDDSDKRHQEYKAAPDDQALQAQQAQQAEQALQSTTSHWAHPCHVLAA